MSGATRRRFLEGFATTAAGGAVLAGCAATHPSAAVARGVVPHGDGALAVATAYEGAVDSEPTGTWILRVDGDGAPDWVREFPSDRWPGRAELFGCCRLGEGALLFGRHAPSGAGRPTGLLHAVAGDGTTRWRRRLDGTARATDAVATGEGVVVAGDDGTADDGTSGGGQGAAAAGTSASIVACLGADGDARWREAVPGVSVTALQRRPADRAGTAAAAVPGQPPPVAGDGLVAAGRADADGGGVPWLLPFDADAASDDGGAFGGFERRYDGEAVLRGLATLSVVGTVDGPVAVATRPGPGATVRPRVELLALDDDWRLGATRALDVTNDRIRAAGDGGGPDGDENARLVAALPGSDGHPLTLVVESGWTTVATLDADLTRVSESVVPAAVHAAERTGDGDQLLAGTRAVGDDDVDAWLAGPGDGRRWTTTFPLDGSRPTHPSKGTGRSPDRADESVTGPLEPGVERGG